MLIDIEGKEREEIGKNQGKITSLIPSQILFGALRMEIWGDYYLNSNEDQEGSGG